MGHPIIMGRSTFASIGRALDGRDSVVLTRSGGLVPGDNIAAASSWADAASAAQTFAAARGVPEVFVIGGAQVFAEAMPHCGRVYLTQVHAHPDGDIFFSPLTPEDWVQVSRAGRPCGPGDDFAVTDLVLDRRPGIPANGL